MQPRIVVHTSTDPYARLRGAWEIKVAGERWFGPDTLAACREALPFIRSAANEYLSVANR